MKIYLGSPNSKEQADAAEGQDVLLSYAAWLKNKPLITRTLEYKSLLLDSGAYSELNSGVQIDLVAYLEWVSEVRATCGRSKLEAWAGLDSITGDWRKSMENYAIGGFPTFHPGSDPPELLDDLIPMARERGRWLGIGVVPPRSGKEYLLRSTLERIPDDLHVHGWALTAYAYLERFDSFDSTHWWRETFKYAKWMPWLTMEERLEIAVKKIQRMKIQPERKTTDQEVLFP